MSRKIINGESTPEYDSLDDISANPQNFKVCDHCTAINKYSNQECWVCDCEHFRYGVAAIKEELAATLRYNERNFNESPGESMVEEHRIA